MPDRGYFGIGIFHGKCADNIGTLWRSAQAFGANFIFTIGQRYKHQSTDTTKAWRHVPYWRFETYDDFRAHIPYDCQVVGVEIAEGTRSLPKFVHPQRCVYLLGAEDHGLTPDVLALCQHVIEIPSEYCLNVAVAGSIVLYDRIAKEGET